MNARRMFAAAAAVLAVGGAAAGCAVSSPVPQPHKVPVTSEAPKTHERASHTVTYIATGSKADIQYGVAGNRSGTSPMTVTMPLDRNQEAIYNMNVLVMGERSVTLVIKIDGKEIARGTASPYHRVAVLAVYRDAFSGEWAGSVMH